MALHRPGSARLEAGALLFWGQRLEIWQAVVLGALQGLGEFLPISSSGHLVVVPALLGWSEHSLQFDVALHLGTLVPILAYFWRDWVAMALALVGRGWGTPEEIRERRKLARVLLVACIPVGIFGALLEDRAAHQFRDPRLVAATLALFGALMLAVDRAFAGRRELTHVRMRDGLLIGAAQVLALVPGVSRSGSTISAGLACHLSREAAARFSFLLSAPVVLGAVLAGLLQIRSGLPPTGGVGIAPALAGIFTAMAVGFVVIPFLLRYLRERDLSVFVYYRWALAALILLLVR